MPEKKEVIEDTSGKVGISFNKKIIFIILIAGLIIFFLIKFNIKKEIVSTCGDGTSFGNCSASKKPYFCENGILIEKSSVCGCPELLTQKDDSCISKYQINPQEIKLNYVLRGEKKEINFTAYKGMEEYLSSISRAIHYSSSETPSRADFKLKNINEPKQRELLLPLVVKIQNSANTKNEQMRIAISIVQNIPFGLSEKNTTFLFTTINYSRYPYEVLYDNEGVCGEKTELLAFLLKEIGYGVGFFYYNAENHETLGIKCPEEKSVYNSGYCFVETSGGAILTDNEIIYSGNTKLISTPEIFDLYDGESLSDNLYEYKDAEKFKKIRNKIKENGYLSQIDRNTKKELIEKYGISENYNV